MTTQPTTPHIANLIDKENCRQIVAHNIKHLIKTREKDNVSIYGINAILGLSESTIQKYLCGSNLPQLHILIKIADYFNVTLDKLVREKL
jgi:transcriptional regulator with XRE-family HTH domain